MSKAIPTTTWITHKEAITRFMADLDQRTVRALMDITPDDEGVVWLNKGSAKQPYYLWDEARVDEWFRRATTWRASRSAEKSSSSAGATPAPQVSSEAEAFIRERKRRRSSEKSKTRLPPADGGSLVTYARALLSSK